MERIETPSTNWPVPVNLKTMFSHAAIERGTAQAKLGSSQRNVTLVARERAFDDALFYSVQMLRFFLAA